MSHTIRKKKLAHRVARIRGQVEALARALDGEAECGDVLRLIASARGAMDSLMAEPSDAVVVPSGTCWISCQRRRPCEEPADPYGFR